MNKLVMFNVLLAIVGTLVFAYFSVYTPDKVMDCYIRAYNLDIPTTCEYANANKDKIRGLGLKSGPISEINLSIVVPNSDVKNYVCPDCPLCICDICNTSSTTPSTSDSNTAGTTLWTPLPANSTGGTQYSVRPTSIDFKYKMCNPFENVSYPIDYVIRESNQTYNFTYLNGTTEIRYRKNETEYKTIKGGCIVIQTAMCNCKSGGYVDTINAKNVVAYTKMINELYQDKKIICPMVMRSPLGCTPVSTCLNGVCTIVGR